MYEPRENAGSTASRMSVTQADKIDAITRYYDLNLSREIAYDYRSFQRVWRGADGFLADPSSYTDGDATPSVSGPRLQVLTIVNASPTTITNFDDEVSGQMLVLTFQDANTTVQHNTDIKLAGAVDFVAGQNDTLTLVKQGASPFRFVEVARSVNS